MLSMEEIHDSAVQYTNRKVPQGIVWYQAVMPQGIVWYQAVMPQGIVWYQAVMPQGIVWYQAVMPQGIIRRKRVIKSALKIWLKKLNTDRPEDKFRQKLLLIKKY